MCTLKLLWPQTGPGLFALKLPAQALVCSENIATCLCLGYDLYAAEACNESSSSVSCGKNPVHVLILFYNTRQSQVSEGRPRDLLQKPSSNPDECAFRDVSVENIYR